ncbi:hypothetical protein [Lelliottia amnigena]
MNDMPDYETALVEQIFEEFGDVEASISDIQHRNASPLCTELLCGPLDTTV